jgi:hypothetical protein
MAYVFTLLDLQLFIGAAGRVRVDPSQARWN